MNLGPPRKGSVIKCRWNDGHIYSGVFYGNISRLFYTVSFSIVVQLFLVVTHLFSFSQVLFEDETKLQLERDSIYLLNEPMPKKILSKLVSNN